MGFGGFLIEGLYPPPVDDLLIMPNSDYRILKISGICSNEHLKKVLEVDKFDVKMLKTPYLDRFIDC